MKLLYASPYYKNNLATGANIRYDEIGKSLVKNCDLIIVVSKDNVPSWSSNAFKIFELKFTNRVFQAIEIFFLGLINHVDFTISDLTPTIPSKKTAYMVHDMRQFSEFRRHSSFINTFFYRINLMLQSFVITVSNFTKCEIIKNCSIKEENIVVSYNGVHSSFKEFKGQRKKIDILYVATFEDRKDHKTLVNAIDLIVKEKKYKDLNALFIGRDLGKKDNVMYLIKNKGLEKNIKIIDCLPRNKLISAYHESKVFCSTSLYEGFGMPIIEARFASLNVVCSKIDVFDEIADDRCVFFEPKNSEELAHKIKLTLLDNNEAIFKKDKDFSWENISNKLLADLHNRI